MPIVCERHGIKAFCLSLAQIPQECAFGALASAFAASEWACACWRGVHTVLEAFPVFEAHPQAAHTVTTRLRRAHTQKEGRHQKKKVAGGGGVF